MSISLNINGVTFAYPETGDKNWGSQATSWASAVTTGMLQKAGGTFTLTAEIDFGATYGTKQAYIKTQTANVASAGFGRLARTDVVSWRNQANAANLDLGVSSSNVLQFNGEDLLAGSIVNADIDAAAAIALSKLAALTASRALTSDGSGVISVSAVTSTELGYVSGVTSAIQTQITARLQLAGGTMTGNLFLNADPSADTQAATKAYVDNAAAGSVNNYTVRIASTAAINLASELENGDTVDGTVLATGDLVLVKNQASTPANGIYVVPASGAASRSTQMDTWTEVIGASVFVTAGTANAGSVWKFNTAAGGTIDVTAIPITQSGASQVYTASGEGIELSGSQFALELDGTTLAKGGSGLKVNEIANAQIAAAAAIAVNKLAAVTASRAVVSDGSGFVSAATTTATEIGYVNGVTSAIQTQINTINTSLTSNQPYLISNAGLACSVGGSALTVALKQADGSTDPSSGTAAVRIAFRSATLTSGLSVVREVTGALSIVVPSGATIGNISATENYLYVYAIDNAGTVEMAIAGSNIFDEGEVHTTTTIGTGSDSNNVLYSTTGRVGVAIRYIGRLLSDNTTAGTWANVPDETMIGFRVPAMPNAYLYISAGNGYGSTWTKIRRYSTTDADIGAGITYTDSAAFGAIVSITEPGIYCVQTADGRTSGGNSVAGITYNDLALTTSISSLTYADGRRAYASTDAGDIAFCSWTGVCYAGDTVKPHSDGSQDATSISAYFSVTQLSRF